MGDDGRIARRLLPAAARLAQLKRQVHADASRLAVSQNPQVQHVLPRGERRGGHGRHFGGPEREDLADDER